MSVIEFASPDFRERTFAGHEVTVPATGFSIQETRAAMESRPGLSKVFDLRKIGCPSEIFNRLIARRAAAAGIKHETTDQERRDKAAETARLIAEDKQRHDRVVSIYQDGI